MGWVEWWRASFICVRQQRSDRAQVSCRARGCMQCDRGVRYERYPPDVENLTRSRPRFQVSLHFIVFPPIASFDEILHFVQYSIIVV